MKDFEVVEYFLDGQNIKGFQIHQKVKHPEFINNPEPNQDMIKGVFFDEYGNYKYSLVDYYIVANNIEPTEEQVAKLKLTKVSLLKILKWIIVGIEDPTNPGFVKLKNEFNKLMNGIDL